MIKSHTDGKTVIIADSLLTSHQVGAILQVNPSSVNKWVKAGRIRAFRTPGGHHRIRAGDLVVFLRDHSMPVPRQLVHAAKKRVLVVDDEPKELKAMRRLFKPYAQRLELRLVQNGIDALVLLGDFKPSLVILDVIMPELDGIEVCRRLKAMPETEQTKVIIASAQLTPDVEREALAAGATCCLQKPMDIAVLFDLLELDPLMGLAV